MSISTLRGIAGAVWNAEYLRGFVEIGELILNEKGMRQLQALLNDNDIIGAKDLLYRATVLLLDNDRIEEASAKDIFDALSIPPARMELLRQYMQQNDEERRVKEIWEKISELGDEEELVMVRFS